LTQTASTLEGRKPKEMHQNGLEEMDKRADAAGSPWRLLTLITFGAVATKLLVSRIAGMLGKGAGPEDKPK
jgi:hypothetical protein